MTPERIELLALDDILTLIPERGAVRKIIAFHDDYDDDIAGLRHAAARAAADEVTASNDDDGVAAWLEQRFA